MWKFTGKTRPPFADAPGPGQESVWDYPRPPALVACDSLVVVRANDSCIAHSSRTQRVLETASPPTYYIPAADIDWDQLVRTADSSFCEWKGTASYWALAAHGSGEVIAWSYENPGRRFAGIDGHASFYPGRIECFVNDERVKPQAGGFYGGWITETVAGPFKGEPGTGHW
jgi:uncharacterized protein (DUF427 family)